MGKKPRKKNQKKVPAQIQPNNSAILHQAQMVIKAGPLPAPEILAQYDKIVPGAAERIINMAETQAKHRQALEKKVIESGIQDSRRGLIFGFFLGFSAIAAGVICSLGGSPTSGAVIGGSGVAGLCAVFVYGSRERRREREAKNKLMMGQQR